HSIKELLGHQDIKVTMRYSHLTAKNLDDSVLLLERGPVWAPDGHQAHPEAAGIHSTSPLFSAQTTEKAVLIHGSPSGSEGGARTTEGYLFPSMPTHATPLR
ncbi:MAG: hypothetical protein Q8M76_03835, partial [Spirochaetaceae bacterium]|nr:hypothetical protein [Spirochaetaceae bacterium]